MPLAEFWYEDIRLFECYVKAYQRRIDKQAWLHGLYVFEAVSAALNNVMPSVINKGVTGKGKWKPLDYHKTPIGTREKKTNNSLPKAGNSASGVEAWSKRIKQLKGMT